MTENAKVIVEVVAGIVPQQPEQEFTRRWALTSSQWEAAEDKRFRHAHGRRSSSSAGRHRPTKATAKTMADEAQATDSQD